MSSQPYGLRWSLDICNSGKRLKRVPLPPGEGAAKRRVRAGMRNVFDQPALTRPFGPPSPGGRGTCSATGSHNEDANWTHISRHERGNEIQNPGRKVESA